MREHRAGKTLKRCAKMAKSMSSFRLSENTEETLSKLAQQKGISKAEVIAQAVEKMQSDEMPYEQHALLEVYNLIGKHAETLGHHETYASDAQPFTTEKAEVLSLLEKMWDMCRDCSVFTEKALPE